MSIKKVFQSVIAFLEANKDARVSKVLPEIMEMCSAKQGGGTREIMQRRLYIGLHERYDTGFRSDFKLPDLIQNPTLPKLVNLMLTGKAK